MEAASSFGMDATRREQEAATPICRPRSVATGSPYAPSVQVMDQQAGKVYGLVKRAMDEEPAALNDLMSRLDLIGLLPYR